MGDIGEKITGMIAAIVGLAVLAIVISQRANTANVLGAFFGGLSTLIGTAISPITGQTPAGSNTALSGGNWAGSSGAGTSQFASSGFNPMSLLSGGGMGNILGGSSGSGSGGIDIASLLGGIGGSGGGSSSSGINIGQVASMAALFA